MAKRGRKPSQEESRSGYFYEKEEQAVLDFLKTDDAAEKDKIYNEILKPAFDKMIESIMRRYKLFVPEESTGDTFNDAASFLQTKANKFDPQRNKRAYSYYGNICKNYLIGRIQNYNKTLERNPSYDTMEDTLSNDIQYSEASDRGMEIACESIDRLVERLKYMTSHAEECALKEGEVKLGKALITLLEHWDFVLSTDKSNKMNKSAILLFLKENTGMDAKGIRDNMKKFKKEFLIIKNDVLNY